MRGYPLTYSRYPPAGIERMTFRSPGNTHKRHSGVETTGHTTTLPWLILEGDLDPVDSERVTGGAGASTVVVVELLEGLSDESVSVPLHLQPAPPQSFNLIL